MFKNQELSAKLLTGFLSLAIVLLIGGALEYIGIHKMGIGTTTITETAPLVDSSMEMKLALEGSMKKTG